MSFGGLIFYTCSYELSIFKVHSLRTYLALPISKLLLGHFRVNTLPSIMCLEIPLLCMDKLPTSEIHRLIIQLSEG